MKRVLLNVLIFFSLVLFCVSCNDAIFYKISEESPLRDPIIDGSPTNFVKYNSKLYVATGKHIWIYNGSWIKWKELNNRTILLAATTGSLSTLYALYLENDNYGKIYDCTNNADVSLPNNENVQSIYAEDDFLFVCARNNNDTNNDIYTIFYIKEGDSGFTQISDVSGFLNGIASDGSCYYLSTKNGFYNTADKTTPSSASLLSNKIFTGIITLNTSSAAAVTDNGELYQISGASLINKASFTDSRATSGALAVYQKDDIYLLLVGRREYTSSSNSGYTNGYVEISLDSSFDITGSSFNEPGKNPSSSIVNNDRYSSSLGIKIINYMFQADDGILFASTQLNGVWSYRDHRDGEGVIWNAE